MMDIDILEYLQYIVHAGIKPSEITLNKAITEIESLRQQLAEREVVNGKLREALKEAMYCNSTDIAIEKANEALAPTVKEGE